MDDRQSKGLQRVTNGDGPFERACRAIASVLDVNTDVDELFEDTFKPRDFNSMSTKKAEGVARVVSMSDDLLKSRRIEEPIAPPLSVAKPVLDAASDETDDELLRLWAALLAAARDPARASRIRKRFIPAVQAMDPLDALVLKLIAQFPNAQPSHRSFMASRLGVSESEVDLSFQNLMKLELLVSKSANHLPGRAISIADVNLTELGRHLCSAVAD